MASTLQLHPDRLFPADPATRSITRRLYDHVRELPIISPHGHVPPTWIADDEPFTTPTELLVTPDHYLTRLLHTRGVPLDDLGVGRQLDEDAARRAFSIVCAHWDDLAGTPVRYWLTHQLVSIFGVTDRPAPATADAIYDSIAATLADPAFTPRALLDRFGIDFLATTDDPCDDLADHAAVAAAGLSTRLAPTFRPDRYLEPASPTWNADLDRLGDVSGIDTGHLGGFIAALESRRGYFKDHGAVSTDHSHADLGTEPLGSSEASTLFSAARDGRCSPDDANRLRRHFVFEMARMAHEDGLTMTLHPGVVRNHHAPTHEAYGADVGCDIPTSVEVTHALRPLLNAFGTSPNFNLVLFTLDETTFSREIAPLVGFYPIAWAGAPWWFLDAPNAIGRFLRAATETIGFTKLSGFIDDTRAFCSIPARHDMARRLDCAHLASLVADHRLDEDEAATIAFSLVTRNPKEAFRL